MRRARTLVLLGLAAGAVLACGTTEYLYRPTEEATATLRGEPAARYDVPPEAPRGSVTVATLGLGDMEVTQGAPKVAFLHVRLVVSNDNDTGPWSVDTREQLAELPGEGKSRPAWTNGETEHLPLITVAPGEKRAIDLYYPLPRGFEKASSIPKFDLVWQVETPAREVATRTPFERVSVEPSGPPVFVEPHLALGFGWGPVWWYDPYFPSYTFRHPFFVGPPHPVLLRDHHHRPIHVGPRHRHRR